MQEFRKTVAAIVIGGLICVSSASGFGRGSYAGGAFQFGAVGALPGPCHGDVCNSIVFHTLLGGQIEYGWFGNVWTLYAGYHHSQAIDRNDHESSFGSFQFSSADHRKWVLNRLIVGARLHVPRKEPNPVKPLIGIAYSFGWTRYTDKYSVSEPSGSYEEITAYGYSKGGGGLLFEAGTLIGPIHKITPFIILQAQIFSADFDRSIPYTEAEESGMVEYSIRIGAQYTLRENLRTKNP